MHEYLENIPPLEHDWLGYAIQSLKLSILGTLLVILSIMLIYLLCIIFHFTKDEWIAIARKKKMPYVWQSSDKDRLLFRMLFL